MATRTVTGTWLDASGEPCTGVISFSPVVRLVDTGTVTTVAPA